MRKNSEYALYKGDKFIDLGTKEYLAKLLGVQEKTILFYASPTSTKRRQTKIKKESDRYIVIKIEENENDF